MKHFYSLLVLSLSCFASFSLGEVTVDDSSPSIFSFNAQNQYDYEGWLRSNPDFMSPFDPVTPGNWDTIAPFPIGLRVMDRATAEKLLIRFQKPGSLNQSTLSYLHAILQSRTAKDHPALVVGALQNLASNPLPGMGTYQFQRTVNSMVLTDRDYRGVPEKNIFRSETEQAQVVAGVLNYTDQFVREKTQYEWSTTSFTDWKTLKPLTPILSKHLTDEKAADYTRSAAFSVARLAKDYHSVDPMKFVKIGKQALIPIFGRETPKVLTDIDLVRNGREIKPFILATHPIQGQRIDSGNDGGAALYGIYLVQKDAVTFEEGAPKRHEVEWEFLGKKFKAKLEGSAVNIVEIVPNEPGPRQEELWKNKTLTGLFAVGSAMGHGNGSDAEGILSDVKSYLISEGFKAKAKLKQSDDLKKFIASKIKDGTLSWFVKDEHSDGDNINLFRINKKGQIETLEKTLPDGRQERVFLLHPAAPGGDKPEAIPSAEVGKWMAERTKRGGGQLIYLNTSCSSAHSKAPSEIGAIGNPSWVEIPGSVYMGIFENLEDNSIRWAIDGIRKGKTWAQIKADTLHYNPDAASGSKDVLLFPDEAEYREMFGTNTHTVKLKAEVVDEKGKPFVRRDLRNSCWAALARVTGGQLGP